MKFPCHTHDLGLIDYAKAYQIQKINVEEVLNGGADRLIFCEHPPVLTMGRLSKPENLLWSAKGVNAISIDRGGDITLHAPGQLVCYPIFNLNRHGRDLRRYLWNLEEVNIDLLNNFDILAVRIQGKTGAWVGADKIASLGVGVRKWISFHGSALNVNTDLRLFSMIRPCGLDVSMTSLAKIKGQPIDMKLVKQKMFGSFAKIFNLSLASDKLTMDARDSSP